MTMPPPHLRPSLGLTHLSKVFALALAATLAPSNFAQPPASKPAREGFMLGTDPIRVEAIGLSMYAPEGASVSSEMLAGTSITTIAPAGATRTNLPWIISVQSRTTTNTKLDLKTVADQTQAQMLNTAAENVISVSPDDARNIAKSALSSTDGTIQTKDIVASPSDGKSSATLLLREPEAGKTLSIGGTTNPIAIERYYVQFPPSPTAPNADPVIRGVTIAKISPTQFVTFELHTTLPRWTEARRMYETVVASASFDNPEQAATQRASLVKAGTRLFEQVTEDELVSLVENQPDTWERIYRPSPTGKRTDDQEVGYRRVKSVFGPRTLVDKSAGANRGVLGQDKGLILQMDARFLDGETIVDSQSVFFMSLDRREETWSIANAVRDPATKQSTVHRERGARTDKTMSVILESPGQEPKSILPQIAGDGYISRVESFLLPRLLVKKQMATAFGFYSYRSEAQTIQFRRDVLIQPKKDGEPWRITSRLGEGQPEQSMLVDKDGRTIRSTLPGGVISEPIELKELLELWKSKGLPVD